MRGVVCVVGTVVQISKIFLFISLAMFSPRIFLFYSSRLYSHRNDHDQSFKLGVENINESTKELFLLSNSAPQVALITNQSGVNQKGERTIDVLCKKDFCIKKIITPLLDNSIGQDAENVATKKDAITGIPMYSLYNPSGHLKEALFDDVGMIIFDVPDISLSHALYIQTLVDLLNMAAHKKKVVIILDRPNLSGEKIEGAVTYEYAKKIAVPLRSGMTVGELSSYINKELSIKADVRIVPMCYYRRSCSEQREVLEYLLHMKLPVCLSSGSSFLGLMAQVEPFDVGIGTDRAFECLLLPESLSFERQKWYELQVILRNSGIESKLYRHFCSLKKEYYTGLHFSMQSVRAFATFNTLLAVLTFFKKSGLELIFSACFDASVGTSLIREVVLGIKNHTELKEKVNADLKDFFNRARHAFMYTPLPELVLV